MSEHAAHRKLPCAIISGIIKFDTGYRVTARYLAGSFTAHLDNDGGFSEISLLDEDVGFGLWVELAWNADGLWNFVWLIGEILIWLFFLWF